MALQIRSIISSLIDLPPLSLYDKTIRFSFPFHNKDGIQLKLNTVDFNSFPSCQGKHGIIEGRAPVGTNIKMLAMSLYHIYDFLRA